MQHLISNEKSIYWLQTRLVKGYKGASGNFVPSCKEPLNVAECELSAMTSQCIKNRRFENIDILIQEIQAWAKKTNQMQKGVTWQFNVENARHKLKSIYPKIQCG
jgi:hypothetical protein